MKQPNKDNITKKWAPLLDSMGVTGSKADWFSQYGFQGGDAGHGGFVRLVIQNLSSTFMEVNGQMSDEFELVFRGTTERQTT